MSILKEESGKFSSKRTVGLSYAALGIVMVLAGVFTDRETDLDILLVVVGTALTALGIATVGKLGKNGSLEIDSTVTPTKPGGPKT